MTEASLPTQDADYQYPLGLASYSFTTNTAANQVSLTFTTDLKPTDVTPKKYNPTTKTYGLLPSSANASVSETIKDNQHALVLSYTITDNDSLDLDPATGHITDPIGLAVTNNTYDTLANTGSHLNALFAIASVILLSVLGLGLLKRRPKVYKTR